MLKIMQNIVCVHKINKTM